MLKTNSKKARENVRQYIIDGLSDEYYDEKERGFDNVARIIYERFKAEKMFDYNLRYYKNNIFKIFEDWCSGLPSILDTCYYYNRSAVDDLGEILEETEEEKSRYSESEAELLLTKLIYREIERSVSYVES